MNAVLSHLIDRLVHGRHDPAQAVVAPAAPVPGDDELLRLAAAHPEWSFPRNGTLAQAHNAHYADTRVQLAYALAHEYNSIECDVRMRDGQPILAHGSSADADLTFEQWARALAASGRMLRIDLKESAAIEPVLAVVERLGIPHDRITLNVAVDAPWSKANISIDRARDLRRRYPDAWITLNMPLPTRVGAWLLADAGRKIGGKVAGTLTDPLVSAALVKAMHAGLAIDVWNEPSVWQPADVAAETAKLRAMGIDGMIDLRRRDDPLARPSSSPATAPA